MRNNKGQFIKNETPPIHKDGCNCFRCTGKVWNKGVTGYKFRKDYIPWNKKLTPSSENIKTIFTCSNCKKQIIDYASNRTRKLQFCDRKCRGQFMSLNNIGENAPNFKGGISKYERNKNWVMKNRNRKYFINLRREARLYGAKGSHTFEEWIELAKFYNFMCLCCKRGVPEVVLTQDHIIPISKGGSDYIDNIQPLCRGCNSRKRVDTIDYRGVFIAPPDREVVA